MVTTRARPTSVELAILWHADPCSVRQVRNILIKTKPTGYTSVLKTMQSMLDKGLLDRDDPQRPQIYRARHSQDRTQKQLLADPIQRVYGESVKALVMHAVGTRQPSPEDVAAIERLLDRYEGDKR